MFLVIPLVEFLHVLGVDINVHHENPATFLCHVSVSSVKRSRHRFASSRWHPVLTPGAPGERRDTNWGAILADIPQIPGLLSAIFRLIEAHRNEIRAQPSSCAANRSVCPPPRVRNPWLCFIPGTPLPSSSVPSDTAARR